MLPEFFTLRNWTRFCLYLNNRQSHGQMDATGGFSASSWSKNTPPHRSDCRLLMLYKVVKELWAEFFALRLWRCSAQPCNNQQNYGQMDVTAGFSRSERPYPPFFTQPPFSLPFSARIDSAGVDSSGVCRF